MRCLLVEDESIVRLMVADMLEQLGHDVVAEAANINSALNIAKTAEFDIAILDINIAGDRIDPVAELIEERGIPFIFASGYGRAGAPEKFRNRPVVQKPFLIESLKDTVEEAVRPPACSSN